MKNPSLIKWSKGKELEGLLFFAQSILDMLFDYNLDTYKVSTLNTNSCANECYFFVNLVNRGLISKNSLDPTIDEFLLFFRNDPIIKNAFGPQRDQYIKEIESKKDKHEELLIILDLVTDYLSSNYLNVSKKQLIDTICHEPKEKRLIYSLTRSFVTELIYLGYSKSYIYFKTKQFFFDLDPNPADKICSPEDIERYMEIFDLKIKSFDLIFKANEQFAKFAEALPRETNPRYSGIYEKGFLEERDEINDTLVQIKDIKAFDAMSARDLGEETFRIWASLLRYNTHKSEDQPAFHTQDQFSQVRGSPGLHQML